MHSRKQVSFFATLIFIYPPKPERIPGPGQVKSAKVPGQVNMLVLVVHWAFEISPGTYSSLVDKE